MAGQLTEDQGGESFTPDPGRGSWGCVTRFGKAFTSIHSASKSLAALETQSADSKHLTGTDLLLPIPCPEKPP